MIEYRLVSTTYVQSITGSDLEVYMNKNFIKVMLLITFFVMDVNIRMQMSVKVMKIIIKMQKYFGKKYLNKISIQWIMLLNGLEITPILRRFIYPIWKTESAFQTIESLFDVDECITNFIKKNDKYLCVESDNIILTHKFWKEDINGEYRLLYVESHENIDENYFKLKNNYYYDVCFYGEQPKLK